MSNYLINSENSSTVLFSPMDIFCLFQPLPAILQVGTVLFWWLRGRKGRLTGLISRLSSSRTKSTLKGTALVPCFPINRGTYLEPARLDEVVKIYREENRPAKDLHVPLIYLLWQILEEV